MTNEYNSWTEFLEALRSGNLVREVGDYVKIVYESSYSDEPQTIESEITSVSETLGKAFRVNDKVIAGWHVNSNGREIGRVIKIEIKKQ